MKPDRGAIARVIASARHPEHGALLEPEALALIEALGLEVPRRIELRDGEAARRLERPPLPGERVVLKVVSPALSHKTDAGGVTVVPNHPVAITAAVDAMERRFADLPVDGFLLVEWLPHGEALGHELLLGLRTTEDFGPVVVVGPGGVHAEFLARSLRPGQDLAMLAPGLVDAAAIRAALGDLAAVRAVTTIHRGLPAPLALERLEEAVERFLWLAENSSAAGIEECEINPLAVCGGRLVALDARVRLARARAALPAPRPIHRMRALLAPRSIAIVGVSEKLNPGRVILENVRREGFPAEGITVVKPGLESIAGCRCVPDLESLSAHTDLVILSIPAAAAPEALERLVAGERAESVVLIPGGLEERADGEGRVAAMRAALARARATPWGGPLINGGNCLGLRSAPGRINTLFIPAHKLDTPPGGTSALALISGSGAFAVATTSKLSGLSPRYTLSIGNQMDLTVADTLEYLKDDPELSVFAVYLEGFRPLDGRRFLRQAREITAGGRAVVLYRGGRTPAGAAAAATHTAAVAGDFEVTRRLAEAAGVTVAESLEDFVDLTRLWVRLGARRAAGERLGAMSNAGFECVAIADSLGALSLARFRPETVSAIGAALERARLTGIVTVTNPIDVTPILADADFEAVARAVLADPGVDVGLIGCVPLTGALATLPAGPAHAEDLTRTGSIAERLIALAGEIDKPWVAVVDAGALYDPFAARLEAGGIPTFRSADRALRLLGRVVAARRGAPRRATRPAPGEPVPA